MPAKPGAMAGLDKCGGPVVRAYELFLLDAIQDIWGAQNPCIMGLVFVRQPRGKRWLLPQADFDSS
jgi:hypothetical protein